MSLSLFGIAALAMTIARYFERNVGGRNGRRHRLASRLIVRRDSGLVREHTPRERRDVEHPRDARRIARGIHQALHARRTFAAVPSHVDVVDRRAASGARERSVVREQGVEAGSVVGVEPDLGGARSERGAQIYARCVWLSSFDAHDVGRIEKAARGIDDDFDRIVGAELSDGGNNRRGRKGRKGRTRWPSPFVGAAGAGEERETERQYE
jgi:hypothetical protein